MLFAALKILVVKISLWIIPFINVKWLSLHCLLPSLWIPLWYGYWHTCIFFYWHLPFKPAHILSNLTLLKPNCKRLSLLENIRIHSSLDSVCVPVSTTREVNGLLWTRVTVLFWLIPTIFVTTFCFVICVVNLSSLFFWYGSWPLIAFWGQHLGWQWLSLS